MGEEKENHCQSGGGKIIPDSPLGKKVPWYQHQVIAIKDQAIDQRIDVIYPNKLTRDLPPVKIIQGQAKQNGPDSYMQQDLHSFSL
jgi:hypothetical protein